MTNITPEYMRSIEDSLTPEQKQTAFAMVESWGWTRDNNPPEYIWLEAFRRARDDPKNFTPGFVACGVPNAS